MTVLHNVATGGDPTRVIGRRLVGAFLESLLDLVVSATLFNLLGVQSALRITGTVAPNELTGQEGKLGAFFVLFLIYVLATKVITLGFWGWTPGMLFMSLRCVRWDGRPPGLLRALGRSMVFQFLAAMCGYLFYVVAWLVMHLNPANRAPQDSVVGTYVIDGIFFGHLMIPDQNGGVYVGPVSVKREEAERYLREQGIQPIFDPAMHPKAKSGEPFLDKNLDTYVMWNARQESWLAFDKVNQTWHRIG